MFSSGDRLSWDGTNITLISTNTTIDASGIRLAPETAASYSGAHAYGFSVSSGRLGLGAWDFSGNRGLEIAAFYNGAGTRFSSVNLTTADGATQATMLVSSDAASSGGRVQISADTQTSISGGAGNLLLDANGSTFTNSMICGSPTGGGKGNGTINVAGDLYKNNTAYTNPDYVFEHWATGRIVRFADRPGAGAYLGLPPLGVLEQHVMTHHRLPQIGDDPLGVFQRADVALELLEQHTLYFFDHEARIAALEARHAV